MHCQPDTDGLGDWSSPPIASRLTYHRKMIEARMSLDTLAGGFSRVPFMPHLGEGLSARLLRPHRRRTAFGDITPGN
jgi:hypothetical protein